MQYPHSTIYPPILAAALLVSTLTPQSTLAAPRSKKQSELHPPASEKTQIRSGSPTFLVTRGSKGIELKHLNVEVKNVGRYPAKGISVFVDVGAGLMNQLRGESSLLPGQSGIYVLRSRMPLVQNGPVRIVSSCGNCRK